MTLQYRRSLRLVYGDQTSSLGQGPDLPFVVDNFDDDGLRVQFSFKRNNTGTSDRCKIRVYNLPEEQRQSMKQDLETQWRLRKDIQSLTLDVVERAQRLKRVADAFRVSLFVGYGDDLQLVFRGDLINMTPGSRRNEVDTVTEIELGDTLLALRDSYMSRAWGPGTTITNIIEASNAALGLDDLGESAKVFISGVSPNAVITKLNNGYGAVGRVADTISEFIDLFGLQWWVRDGLLYFVPQGATLQDYSIQLQEGVDLLSFTEPQIYDDIKGRALLNPNIVPGRGLVLFDEDGNPLDDLGFRVNKTHGRGDTDGQAWWVDFDASTVDNTLFAPVREFLFAGFTAQERIDLLAREFQQ